MKTALLILAVPFVAFYGLILVGLCLIALRGRNERRDTRAIRGSRYEDFELMRN